MTRRARLLAVVVTLAVGAVGVISSTQTWLVATLDDPAPQSLAVPGAAAVPVLAPLSLAALALGAALTIVGLTLRLAFGVVTLAIAGTLGYLSAQIAITTPVAAVASTVTSATGITGEDAIAARVTSVTATMWPMITLVCCVVLFAAGVFTLVTARTWSTAGRRFESEQAPPASRPVDAVDSWDDLSRGADPTADPTAGPR